MCGSVQYEKNLHNTCMKITCKILALENVLWATVIVFDCRGSSVLVDCIFVLVRIWFSQQLSGNINSLANMILYLESVDWGLTLAHINIYLALICFRIRQLFAKAMYYRSSMAARISWINELICPLEILGDKISRLLLLNHDTNIYLACIWYYFMRNWLCSAL